MIWPQKESGQAQFESKPGTPRVTCSCHPVGAKPFERQVASIGRHQLLLEFGNRLLLHVPRAKWNALPIIFR